MNMKYYKGSFTKTNGESRTMFFVRTEDLPASFVNENTTGTGKSRKLKEGFETVWDLDVGGWRTFNWHTADVEGIQTFDGNKNILNNFKTSNVS